MHWAKLWDHCETCHEGNDKNAKHFYITHCLLLLSNLQFKSIVDFVINKDPNFRERNGKQL